MSAPQPTALLLKAPRELAFEPLDLVPLGPDEVRIRTLYSRSEERRVGKEC